MRPIITLLTDFGTADGYVAEMKGVLFSAAPDVSVVDLSHDIPPQDVESARLAVARYWRRFPSGTVHIVVVDPGVGSPRSALAVHSDDRFLVGPDNGVLSPSLLASGSRAVALPVPPTAAPTFHGRDVFAPAAASLATGTPIDALGVACHDPVILRTPEARRGTDGSVIGEVIADRSLRQRDHQPRRAPRRTRRDPRSRHADRAHVRGRAQRRRDRRRGVERVRRDRAA